MDGFDWPYVGSLAFFKDFWVASGVVVALSVLTWVLGTVAGFFVALAKESRRRWLRLSAAFRGASAPSPWPRPWRPGAGRSRDYSAGCPIGRSGRHSSDRPGKR